MDEHLYKSQGFVVVRGRERDGVMICAVKNGVGGPGWSAG